LGGISSRTVTTSPRVSRRQLVSRLAAVNMTRLPSELQIPIFGWLFTFEHAPIVSNDPDIFHTQFHVANLRATSLPLPVLGAEIDVPYPCSHWLGQTVPSFDPKRATALWPSTFHELMVITLFRVTAFWTGGKSSSLFTLCNLNTSLRLPFSSSNDLSM
jgi:hypothetical protein